MMMMMMMMMMIIIIIINPIQDGLFWGCSWMGGGVARRPPLLEICHTHPTMMKFGTQGRFKKYIDHVTNPLNSADISIF